MKDQKKSILEMARGAILERVDEEVKRVIVNIMDNETLASAKRKVVVTVEFKPDASRQNIQVKATAKSTLAPKKCGDKPCGGKRLRRRGAGAGDAAADPRPDGHGRKRRKCAEIGERIC